MKQAPETTSTSPIQSLLAWRQDVETIQRHINILTQLINNDRIDYNSIKQIAATKLPDISSVREKIKKEIIDIENATHDNNIIVLSWTILLNKPLSTEELKSENQLLVFIYYLMQFYNYLIESSVKIERVKQQISRYKVSLDNYLTILKSKKAIAEALEKEQQ